MKRRIMINPKIYFSILNTGWIHSDICIKLPRWLKECPYEVYFESSNARPIENNRNQIVQRFLKSDCTHLLQLDNDTVPARNPLELVEYKKDIISCPVPIYDKVVFLNVFSSNQNQTLHPLSFEEKGLVHIDATGTGCIMCSRRVLERIKKPFERQYNEDGIETLGLDLFFSQKANDANFEIYTHCDYISKHYKEIDLINVNTLL